MNVELENTSEFANCWINGTVEQDENVKRDQTIEFVTLFNMFGLLKEYECKIDIQLNLWQYWLSATVEIDENVKRDKTIDTTEFVTMLNK